MINLFGEEVSLEEFNNAIKRNKKRYITMQERYGIKENFKCKNCKHFLRKQYSKTYFKCALWHISSSEATDIRANATACNKYEEK